MTQASSESPSAPAAQEVANASRAGPRHLALPVLLRGLCLLLAVLVFYAQFGMLVTTCVYRYSETDLKLVEGGNPRHIKVWTLLTPSREIGTRVPEALKDHVGSFSLVRDVLIAAFGAGFGSVGLFAAAGLRARHWRDEALLLALCWIGAMTALLIWEYQGVFGIRSVAQANYDSTSSFDDRVYYVAHGWLEEILGLMFPPVAYILLALLVLGLAGVNALRRRWHPR